MSKKILVLGARSWIGYRLNQKFNELGWDCLGTSSKLVDGSYLSHVVRLPEDISTIISTTRPDVVVNLLRGEDVNGFNCHLSAVCSCEKIGAKYVYASSALALDGYENQLLEDCLPARSVSEYGKFKGQCEDDVLMRDGLDGLILRFSSIHGWSPWGITRTESILQRVASGEEIKVAEGVVQNRLSDLYLANSIADLIESELFGVIHLGTTDSSEEYNFIQTLVSSFGYPTDSVVLHGRRRVNLALVPSTLTKTKIDAYSERDTIDYLLESEELNQYNRNGI